MYTGYTTDIRRRMRMHNEGKAAKYTRGRGPVKLRYLETGESKSWGMKREREIKGYTRDEKLKLIAQGRKRHAHTKKL